MHSNNDQMETRICEECLTQFMFTPCYINGKRIPRYDPTWCDQCFKDHKASSDQEWKKKQQQEALDASVTRFKESVPPMYLDTDKNRLQFNSIVAVDSYQFSPKGVGFIGKSGAGKTRAAVLLLLRLAAEGRNCYFLPCTKFANACADQFSNDPREANEAWDILNKGKTTEVILLDDLGKNKMTDRAEASLYELLEERTSHRKPTIWTSNSNGTQLHRMFSPDRASAILRRLSEFSDIHTF